MSDHAYQSVSVQCSQFLTLFTSLCFCVCSQLLSLLTLAVVAVLAAAQTQQGRRWVWPSSDAERFSGYSFRSLGGRPIGRSFGPRRPPPGTAAVHRNRLVTSGTPPATSPAPLVTSSKGKERLVLPLRPGFERRLSHNANGGVFFGITRIFER